MKKKLIREFVQESCTIGTNPEFEQFRTYSEEKKRYLYYIKNSSPTQFMTKIKVDGYSLTYTAYTQKWIGCAGRIFPKTLVDFSFKVDRKTDKIWKSSNNIPWVRVFIEIKDFEFASKMPTKFHTKSITDQILLGKITNPKDLVKKYLSLIKHPDWPWKASLEWAHRSSISLSVLGAVCSNPIAVLDNPIATSSMLLDMVNQALALNKKFDFRWSEKRLRETHSSWTRELQQMELKSIDNTPIWNPKYVDELAWHDVELLNTEIRVFEEGINMHHCIYTNYIYRIKYKTYIALHIKNKIGPITIGLYIHNIGGHREPDFDQAYHKYNDKLEDNERLYVKYLLKEIKPILVKMIEEDTLSGQLTD